ncbi:unnamed protein product, partial [Pylaiella littoralis]
RGRRRRRRRKRGGLDCRRSAGDRREGKDSSPASNFLGPAVGVGSLLSSGGALEVCQFQAQGLLVGLCGRGGSSLTFGISSCDFLSCSGLRGEANTFFFGQGLPCHTCAFVPSFLLQDLLLELVDGDVVLNINGVLQRKDVGQGGGVDLGLEIQIVSGRSRRRTRRCGRSRNGGCSCGYSGSTRRGSRGVGESSSSGSGFGGGCSSLGHGNGSSSCSRVRHSSSGTRAAAAAALDTAAAAAVSSGSSGSKSMRPSSSRAWARPLVSSIG